MSDAESRSIAKQIKRYAQVGGVVGKLATKLASQKYLGVKLDKEKHALEIREALGGIKGPLMKVAQLSATIPDLLPDEYTKELMHLQSNAPPMGWLFVKRRMATELSSDWLKNFKEFDKTIATYGFKRGTGDLLKKVKEYDPQLHAYYLLYSNLENDPIFLEKKFCPSLQPNQAIGIDREKS